MPLRSTLSDVRNRFQGGLFSELAEEVGPLLERRQQFVRIPGPVEAGRFVAACPVLPVRPLKDRQMP